MLHRPVRLVQAKQVTLPGVTPTGRLCGKYRNRPPSAPVETARQQLPGDPCGVRVFEQVVERQQAAHDDLERGEAALSISVHSAPRTSPDRAA